MKVALLNYKQAGDLSGPSFCHACPVGRIQSGAICHLLKNIIQTMLRYTSGWLHILHSVLNLMPLDQATQVPENFSLEDMDYP